MRQKVINRILDETESGYDQMAEKFSRTRKNFWDDLAFIADYVRPGGKLLDYGCGNGRLLEIFRHKSVDYTGVDVSVELIKRAKEKYPVYRDKFFKISSQGSLAFPDDFFNLIVAIAVFHHFPEEHARAVAQELYRVTGPGGRIVITVWNLHQGRFWKNRFGPKVILGKLFRSKEYAGFDRDDILIPFHDDQGHVFKRYHRVYTEKSLEAVFSSAGFGIERCFLAEGRNIVLIGKKV